VVVDVVVVVVIVVDVVVDVVVYVVVKSIPPLSCSVTGLTGRIGSG
jgi:hypothetical protein